MSRSKDERERVIYELPILKVINGKYTFGKYYQSFKNFLPQKNMMVVQRFIISQGWFTLSQREIQWILR